MKTPKTPREVTQAVEALSNGSRRSTRQSLKRFAYQEDATGNGETENYSGSSDHGDGLQSNGSSLGKRKRPNASEVFMDGLSNGTPPPSKASNQKPRRQPARRIKGPNGTVTIEPPTEWERVYNMTSAMRKRVLAPVDTMGCESLHEVHRSPRDQRLQILTSLMLSSQTKDTVTAAAINNLQANLPGGLNLEALLAVEPAELNELICKVGFHNNKTKYIKQTAILLRDQFNSDIPDTIDGLVSLPGVGPKMAYLCMSAGWGRDEGIGVDVHVHRITNLWRWHKTNTPEQTRMELESWLPKEKWHDINHLLVGFGQTICLPVGRKCDQCDLATEKLCPSRQAVKTTSPVKKRVKTEVKIKTEDGETKAVKVDEMKIETDDAGVRIEADLQDDGKVEIQALRGADDQVKLEPATE